jgi:hypothetical protein
MTKSCALLNFDRLYVTSYDAIWKREGKQDIGQIHVREHRRGNKKGQSRETGNIGFIRQRTNKR